MLHLLFVLENDNNEEFVRLNLVLFLISELGCCTVCHGLWLSSFLWYNTTAPAVSGVVRAVPHSILHVNSLRASHSPHASGWSGEASHHSTNPPAPMASNGPQQCDNHPVIADGDDPRFSVDFRMMTADLVLTSQRKGTATAFQMRSKTMHQFKSQLLNRCFKFRASIGTPLQRQ